MVDAYLKCLSLLGLNEPNTNNLDLFSKELIGSLKESLEITKEEFVLEFFIRAVDEALADMFLIKTLAIDDYSSYWNMIQPLFVNSFYNEADRTKYFGVRNAIIAEYFDLISSGGPQEQAKYNIPLFPYKEDETSSLHKAIVNDLRFIFIVPMAQYLSNKELVFPETLLFQKPADGEAISSERELILILREQYKKFIVEF